MKIACAACVKTMLLVVAGVVIAKPERVQAADAALPSGVKAVWQLEKADQKKTPSRHCVSINGLWRWQPARPNGDRVPDDGWGFFKVPGCWPGITNYMQKDCQTVHAHQAWASGNLADVTAAWYQRPGKSHRNFPNAFSDLARPPWHPLVGRHPDGSARSALGGPVDQRSVHRPAAGVGRSLSLLPVVRDGLVCVGPFGASVPFPAGVEYIIR